MTQTTSRMLALAAISATVALGSCGGDDGEEPTEPAAQDTTPTQPEEAATVDAAAVEKQLKRNLKGISMPALPVPVYPPGGGPPDQTQLGGGKVKVRSVSCPGDIPAEKGYTFTCDVDAGKTDASVRLTELNDSGTKLRFKATLKSEIEGGVTETTRLRGNIDTTK